jgi:hypothetical protein
MHTDDLVNLWPWFKQKGAAIWSGIHYERITSEGLLVRLGDRRRILLEADNLLAARGFTPNRKLAEAAEGLVDKMYIIGSATGRGLTADAIVEGARIGYHI